MCPERCKREVRTTTRRHQFVVTSENLFSNSDYFDSNFEIEYIMNIKIHTVDVHNRVRKCL